MKIKTILEKILGLFSGKKQHTEKNEYEQAKELTKKVVKVKQEIEVIEKPKAYINREYTTEQIQINAKLKELQNRKLNFCFIPPKQNSVNVRSMLEFIYRELPKKAPLEYKGKLRYFLWSKTRKIMEKKHREEKPLLNDKGEFILNDNGKKIYEEFFVCEVCGESGKYNQGYKHNTECHEVWKFDDKYKTAVLIELMVLCPDCHKTAHLNMHEHNEEDFKRLTARYCFVNNLLIKGENGLEPDFDKFNEDYKFALEERERRKEKKYNLDVTVWYRKFNYSIKEDNKLPYFDIKNGNVRFRTDNEEFINFIEEEFKDNKQEG